MSKISLRKAYKKIRDNLTDNEVKTLSASINNTLLTQNEYTQASNIGSYYPINNEVIIKNIEGTKYFYPKINTFFPVFAIRRMLHCPFLKTQ